MTTISKDNPQFFELTKYMWESNMITVDEMRELLGLGSMGEEEGSLTRAGWWALDDKHRFNDKLETVGAK